MAFTFTLPTYDEYGVFTLKATTNTSSAAGTFNLGFTPRRIEVFDVTSPIKFDWNNQMPAGYAFKTAADGTLTYPTSNGITVVGQSDTPSAQPAVTLGTALHVNSTTYQIVCYR